MTTNDKDPGQTSDLVHLQEAYDLAQAHLLAAEEADAWLAAPDSEAALDEALAAHVAPTEVEATRALFAPLAPEARSKILDSVVAGYLQSTPPTSAKPTPITSARPRVGRWWLASLPLTAAAAAAATLLIVHRGTALDGPLPGEVHISSAKRGDSSPTAAESSLRLAPDERFYLDCHAAGREITVVGAHAVPSAPIDGDVSPRLLGGERIATTANGATLHLRASLPPGAWAVACDVHDSASGRLMTLAPAAPLIVGQ